MISEHQDGKTEPAFHSTVWDFGVGKFDDADQLRKDVSIDGQANITLILRNSELPGQLVAATQSPKARL